jgi:hypothetical protein
MKLNQSIIALVTTLYAFSPAHADVTLFHPGKHKTSVGSMKEDIEHNRDEIFTNGIKLNSLKMKVDDQDVKINFNKQLIKEDKEVIDKNKSDIKTNKGKIEKQQQEINHNQSKTMINEINIKENQKETLANTKNIAKNNKKISDASGLISENTTNITQLHFNQQRFETKTEHKFAAMDKRIGDNHNKAMAGISSAMSMSAIPRVEGKVISMGLGGGSYGGQSAVAFGSHFKLGNSARASTFMSYDTSKNMGVAAGISIGW